MRGTRGSLEYQLEHYGIIPAYAGNTPRAGRGNAGGWDHPRVCGEHHRKTVLGRTDMGSSPRMRGTLFHCCSFGVMMRIIPAYAGNT